MSYFSLLEPLRIDDGNYDVHHCHINVWSLRGLFGHRPMVIDIGVLFVPCSDGELRAMNMVIPARVARQIDLAAQVAASQNAQLIFGRHFQSCRDRVLTLADGEVAVVAVVEKLDKVATHRDLTALRVGLSRVPPEGRCYLRVRFAVDGTGTMWRWHWAAGRRAGALIDLRVHDPREGGAERDFPAEIHDQDKPIPRLDAFFMLPERFQISGQNPPLAYTRTLEEGRWRDYLRRSPTGRSRRERLLVHRWKAHPAEELAPGVAAPLERPDGDGGHAETEPAISQHRPFRGYMQFNRSPPVRPFADVLLGAVTTVALLFALTRIRLRTGPHEAATWLADQLEAGITQLGDYIVQAAVVGTILLLARFVPKVPKGLAVVAKAKRLFKRVEYWWFAICRR